MNGAIIKSIGTEARVRHLASAARSPSVAPVDPLQVALERAEAEIAKLRADLDAADQREADAHEAGIAAGRKEADDRSAERNDRLHSTAGEAVAAWTTRLAELETLAVTLARAALARLFDQTDDLGILVERTIARHVAGLREQGIVAIHVSAEDFPETTPLPAGIAIIHDPAAAPGSCRVELCLGETDIGIDQQWRALDAFLATLEAPR